MDKAICEIVAELGRTKNQQDYLTKSKEFKVGSILKLDEPFHHITLFANGNLIAKGNIYAADENFAFNIGEMVNNDFDGSYGEDLIYDGIRVELARREIPLKEIKELKIKDVIKFDREIKAVTIKNNYYSYPEIHEVYADIFIGGKLAAKGVCMGVDDNHGIKITEIISD